MFPASVELAASVAVPLGVAPGTLQVRRAWPRDAGRVSMELTDHRGRTVAGQWIRDAERLDRVARQTARTAPAGAVHVGHGGLLLQSAGADRRLLGLRAQLDRPGSRLLVHRPERRAVVSHPPVSTGSSVLPARYARVLRPGRSSPVVQAAMVASALAAPLNLHVPQVVEHDAGAGVVTVTAVPGVAMDQLLSRPTADAELAEAWHAVGRVLRQLHLRDPGDALQGRDAAAEAAWLTAWQERVAVHLPDWAPRLRAARTLVDASFSSTTATARGPIHADLHDGQVLVDTDGSVGVVDWDTVAVGEGVHDVANLLVHLELRAAASTTVPAVAEHSAAALLAGYRPTPAEQQRIGSYGAALRLRLACQYAFRPRQRHLSQVMLERVTAPFPGSR